MSTISSRKLWLPIVLKHFSTFRVKTKARQQQKQKRLHATNGTIFTNTITIQDLA